MGELWLFIGKMMIIEGMLSELKLFPMITQSFLNNLPSFTKTPQVTLHPTIADRRIPSRPLSPLVLSTLLSPTPPPLGFLCAEEGSEG